MCSKLWSGARQAGPSNLLITHHSKLVTRYFSLYTFHSLSGFLRLPNSTLEGYCKGRIGVILISVMSSPGLVDSHLHLQDYGQQADIGAIIRQAEAVGVSHLVCNGTSEEDWPKLLDLAEKYPQIVPCFGLHPWFVNRRSEGWISILEDFLQNTVSGVGEIGLDWLHIPPDKELQIEVFRIQLELARRFDRPVMVHCVKAWGMLMDILRDEPELPRGMLIHAYGGPADLVEPLVRMGAYFTFSGTVLLENRKRAREALAAVPIDRLLMETDAPYMLPPEKYRNYQVDSSDGEVLNHPANLPGVLKGIAELLQMRHEELQEKVWQNAQTFYGPILANRGRD